MRRNQASQPSATLASALAAVGRLDLVDDVRGYNQVHELAQAAGVRAAELIAADADNDPFYCGAPAHRAMAAWFRNLWQRFGYSNGIHLRRIHYQLISQAEPATRYNGQPYQNTTTDWKHLNACARYARYLGLVDARLY